MKLSYLSSFGIESDQQLMSQGDADNFFRFAGLGQACLEGREVGVIPADTCCNDVEDVTDAMASSVNPALSF